MNTRYRCLSCQQRDKTFSPYIDPENGEYIHPTVARLAPAGASGKGFIMISAKSREHIDTLKEKILTMFYVQDIRPGDVMVTNLRHYQNLLQTYEFNADILISWNFKHIVNITRIRGYNSVNIKNGHRALEIRTPREILEL